MKSVWHAADRLRDRYGLELTPELQKEFCERIRSGDRAHFVCPSGAAFPNRSVWNVRVLHKLVTIVVELDSDDGVHLVTVLPPSKDGVVGRSRGYRSRRTYNHRVPEPDGD